MNISLNDYLNLIDTPSCKSSQSASLNGRFIELIDSNAISPCVLIIRRVIFFVTQLFKTHEFHYPTNIYLFTQFKKNTEDKYSELKYNIANKFNEVFPSDPEIEALINAYKEYKEYEAWSNSVRKLMKSGSDDQTLIKLLDNDFCINPIGSNCTPLHWLAVARENCNPEVVDFIVKRGIKPAAIDDKRGNAALTWAIGNGNFGTALVFIQKFIEHLDIRDLEQKTALHLAILKGYKDTDSTGKKVSCSAFDLATALIANGANIGLTDNKGNTALHYAALRRDLPTIQLLLEKDANPNAKNFCGETPKDFLEKDNDTANTLLKQLVIYYYFNSSERDQSLEEARNLLSNSKKTQKV